MPDDYGSPEEWAACEAQRAAACKAYDDERRAAAVREQPRVIERLSEQVIDLEVRAFWAEALLAAAVERAEFLEEMLGLVLRGDWAPARPGLRAVAVMRGDGQLVVRLAALREHAAAELAEASTKQGPDALEHVREARAALQRALELEREAA